MPERTIIVGAGVAGLRTAGKLRQAGREVLVLERARGLGGRCATRSFEGQPVDFGPLFLHGSHPHFLKALSEVPGANPIQDWPRRVQGTGLPCQPEALDPAVRRLAFAEGVKAFPRHLAAGLDVRLNTTVTAIRVADGGFEVLTPEAPPLFCRDLVLALALEQSRTLLQTLPASPELAGLQGLLGLFGSIPCLTVLAGFALEAPEPPWDLLYPEASELLQLVAQDSSKRKAPRFRVLVAQARPAWSRRHLDSPVEQWQGAILEELAALAGPWARQPLWVHPHSWRYARVGPTSELAQPVRLTFPGGQCLGLAGEVFSPGGGVQAAWLSGNRMAERLLQKDPA